jgi:hypothetical protein
VKARLIRQAEKKYSMNECARRRAVNVGGPYDVASSTMHNSATQRRYKKKKECEVKEFAGNTRSKKLKSKNGDSPPPMQGENTHVKSISRPAGQA